MGLTFDLNTGMLIASKVGNLHSEFISILRALELFTMYATDGRTDGQKQSSLPRSLRAERNSCTAKTLTTEYTTKVKSINVKKLEKLKENAKNIKNEEKQKC